MKKIILTYILTLGAIAQLSAAVFNPGFIINAKVPKLVEGQKVYLKVDETSKSVDSTVVTDGKFIFKGQVVQPQLYNLAIKKTDPKQRFNYIIPVFVENSSIDVNAHLDSTTTELELLYTNKYPYYKIQVNGSKSHLLYQKFIEGYEPLNKISSQAFDDYIKYLNPGKDKQKGPISEGIRLVEKIDETKLDVLNYVKSFIKNNRSSAVAIYIASRNLRSFSLKEINDVLSWFPKNSLTSTNGLALKGKAEKSKQTAVGANYVDFDFKDQNDKPVKLSELIVKGQYTLLEFWASWCGPCRADIPHLKEVYQLYHPVGFNVISISLDDKKEKWLKAIDEEKMEWAQVSDLKAFGGELSKIYNFNGIPTCILIGPDGTIVTRNMRGLWMDKKLIALYGNRFGEKY